MSLVGRIHASSVFPRRVQRIADFFAQLLPQNASVLDIGSGDGSLDALIMQKRPDVRIQGIDVLIRPDTKIPTTAFDGRTIPFPDASFDAAMFVDVLHHTDWPEELLREAARVTRQGVFLKDHLRSGLVAGPTLRFMDYVGNAHHGVRLPYNYLSPEEWKKAYSFAGLATKQEIRRLNLYPFPASLLFDRTLHFVAVLEKANGLRAAV